MPKRKPDANTPIENILVGHNPEVRALVERLRKIIRETIPAATESATRFGTASAIAIRKLVSW